jgi:hypothetical protein
LESDLKKFRNRKRKLERPQYYLFATNVALTAVPKVGGRARIESLLESYATKLGMKDFGVWDYNDLRGFLDGEANIRKAYGMLITAGDVLAITAEAAKISKPKFVEVMHTFLQKELLGDTAAKLQFGGDDTDVRIPPCICLCRLAYSRFGGNCEYAIGGRGTPDGGSSLIGGRREGA